MFGSIMCGEWSSERAQGALSYPHLLYWSAWLQCGFGPLVWQEDFSYNIFFWLLLLHVENMNKCHRLFLLTSIFTLNKQSRWRVSAETICTFLVVSSSVEVTNGSTLVVDRIPDLKEGFSKLKDLDCRHRKCQFLSRLLSGLFLSYILSFKHRHRCAVCL